MSSQNFWDEEYWPDVPPFIELKGEITRVEYHPQISGPLGVTLSIHVWEFDNGAYSTLEKIKKGGVTFGGRKVATIILDAPPEE